MDFQNVPQCAFSSHSCRTWNLLSSTKAACRLAAKAVLYHDAGTKREVAEAYAAGQILPAGKDAELVQQTLNLQHWLESDALYGMEYAQVAK